MGMYGHQQPRIINWLSARTVSTSRRLSSSMRADQFVTHPPVRLHRTLHTPRFSDLTLDLYQLRAANSSEHS